MAAFVNEERWDPLGVIRTSRHARGTSHPEDIREFYAINVQRPVDSPALPDINCDRLVGFAPEDDELSEIPKFGRRRKGERVLMRVPIEVRGTGADGNPMEEKTHTGVVSELGAMVRTSRMFHIGTKVVVINLFSQQTAQFRVVWVKDYQEGDYWEIGLEAVSPLNDFWGVQFRPQSNLH